jgi:hypothetical protein
MYWTPAYRQWQEDTFAPWNQEPPDEEDEEENKKPKEEVEDEDN